MSIIKNQIQVRSLISSAKRSIRNHNRTKSALPRSGNDDADDEDVGGDGDEDSGDDGNKGEDDEDAGLADEGDETINRLKRDDGHDDNVNDVVMTMTIISESARHNGWRWGDDEDDDQSVNTTQWMMVIEKKIISC